MRFACVLIMVLMAGCSSQAWYEGGQESQRQRCYQQPDNVTVQQCLDAIKQHNWQKYEEERKSVSSPATSTGPQP